MAKRDDILEAAESLFSVRGFHAVPVDAVIAAAGVSPRTLYAHFSSKEALAVAVLEARHERFLGRLAGLEAEPAPIAAMFEALEAWLFEAAPTGCVFLRALGEFESPAIEACVDTYKAALWEAARRLTAAQGLSEPEVDQIVVLIEGASALAPTLGAQRACRAARTQAESIHP